MRVAWLLIFVGETIPAAVSGAQRCYAGDEFAFLPITRTITRLISPPALPCPARSAHTAQPRTPAARWDSTGLHPRCPQRDTGTRGHTAGCRSSLSGLKGRTPRWRCQGGDTGPAGPGALRGSGCRGRQRHSDARVRWRNREKGMPGENPSVCRNHRTGYFLSVKLNGLGGGLLWS